MKDKTITVGSRTFSGELVPFTVVDNTGVQLRLEDDTLLVLRPVVFEVIRTSETDANGLPVYVVQQTTLVQASKFHEESEDEENP